MKLVKKSRKWLFLSIAAALLVFAVVKTMNTVGANQPTELRINRADNEFVLNAGEFGDFYRTAREISGARAIDLSDSTTKVFTWNEAGENGSKIPFYAISLDGKTIAKIEETSFEMKLRYANFDPLVEVPATSENLTARNANVESGVYIVQFVTQPLDEYRSQIAALGGKNYIYLPNHSYLFRMNAKTKSAVEKLPFVRWVGRYQPAYKLEEFLNEGLANRSLPTARYNIMVLERGAEMQGKLAQNISVSGGKIEMTAKEGFRLQATLSPEQLLAVANDEDVLFIDRWSEPEADMDIVREVGGANFIENTTNFKGQGVRAEVMDGGLVTNHTDFQSGLAPLLHGTIGTDNHGTATYGINFGRGTTNPAARGMLPEAQGIIAGYPQLTNRYTHTAQLLQEPYKAVYQSNSWGDALTTSYTTISAEMDDILFINDFTLLNSQSNAGSRSSRPQAWAKNVISIGGIRHFNTASFTDDRWQSGASIGPATDGRIKPELAHFYDSVFTTYTTTTNGYGQFSGTSAATPITAGHFGIFFQMWHNGLFGNPTGATVFDSRPHMTTAKAIMINTAVQWDMTIAGTDITRVRQGFGRVDVKNLYNLRNKMLVVNETDVLTNLQSKTYSVTVPAGSTDPLKVTMVYADPMGSPSATLTRINNLSLKVTAPDGTNYYGNNGLLDNMWSAAGGRPNSVDTTQNVFIQTPAAGTWTIEINAAALVQDARTETPGVIDADYALVASGIVSDIQTARTKFDFDGDGRADVSVFRPSNGAWYLQQSTSGFTGLAFGLSTDKLAPADYDGDGKTDVAVVRNGNWYIQRSSLGFTATAFGDGNDIPVPADYDGDGKADIVVFRPSNATWYGLNSSNGQFFFASFGSVGDKPVPADYDGDGKANFAVFRPSNGTWYTSTNPANNYGAIQFGTANDKLVPADYDGDGKVDVAVFSPSNGNWYINRSQAGFVGVAFGLGTDVPVPADYDGDGKADVAVVRNGNWYLNRSTAGFTGIAFGASDDKFIPNVFVP